MIVLDPWQKEVLGMRGDLGICTGRRVGKTYILARKAIDRMIEDGKPVIVVSLTEDQAMIIIQMALSYAREAYPEAIGKGKYKPTLKTLTIMRDRKPVKLISRPVGNTGDATRGFEGGVLIVDEASRMPRLFWIAAKPVLLTMAGEIWMASTPFGKQGYFWENFKKSMILKDPEARYKFFYKSTEEVINERPISESWTKEQRDGALRMLEEEKKDMSALEYGQEYQGLFLDELRQFFTDDWIESVCTIEPDDDPKKKLEKDYFLGVDVGMTEDPSAFAILDGTRKESIKQIDGYELRQIPVTATTREVIRLNDKWDFNKIGLDSTGIGAGVLAQLLEERSTKFKTLGLDNAKKVVDSDDKEKPLLKDDMYMNLLVRGEKSEIKLLNIPEVKESLRSVQTEMLEKRIRFFGRNTHMTEAIIRAAYLIKSKQLKPFVYSI